MTEKIHSKNPHVIWQCDPEDGVSEKALVVETYSDVVTIKQDGRYINVNYGTIDDLCRLLRKLKNEQ